MAEGERTWRLDEEYFEGIYSPDGQFIKRHKLEEIVGELNGLERRVETAVRERDESGWLLERCVQCHQAIANFAALWRCLDCDSPMHKTCLEIHLGRGRWRDRDSEVNASVALARQLCEALIEETGGCPWDISCERMRTEFGKPDQSDCHVCAAIAAFYAAYPKETT